MGHKGGSAGSRRATGWLWRGPGRSRRWRRRRWSPSGGGGVAAPRLLPSALSQPSPKVGLAARSRPRRRAAREKHIERFRSPKVVAECAVRNVAHDREGAQRAVCVIEQLAEPAPVPHKDPRAAGRLGACGALLK
eukprot:gene3818-biopygen15854